ncbi:dihydroorotate dehydrogenase [Sphagnurus paluster]|uniref:Orotidine 5'-phosphate decarboxylase n=1 Tax=Sphagnurus paluster TaxID=117069 RepID=A0A9P7G2E2_9AGAR|nr:dihydroorotate dehydrogenase [Sphagnurus paluster]
MVSPRAQSYAQRALKQKNPTAKLLLETMERKKSNLAVSVDVTKTKDFLAVIDVVGPYTHIDILEDFDEGLIRQLQDLSKKHDFVIFEDRKFADIGNTVALQYSSGVHKIASWSHITNAHPVPGPSIITGLASVGLPLGRGLLLLAEMSTKGALTTGVYCEEAVRMARTRRDFVIGFIAQRRMEAVGLLQGEVGDDDEDFLILSPGVGLHAKGDTMGQQYRTPKEVVLGSGCDLIIVGRGIYGNDLSLTQAIAERARQYMQEGWEAYMQRITTS